MCVEGCVVGLTNFKVVLGRRGGCALNWFKTEVKSARLGDMRRMRIVFWFN